MEAARYRALPHQREHQYCFVASEPVKPGELAPPVNVKTKRVWVEFFSADFSEKTDDVREKNEPLFTV